MTPMVPKMRVANRPACQRNRRVQNGSSPAGPLGHAARLAFIEARKAWVRPVPPVSAMGAGRDDGTIQPTMASTIITGLISKGVFSEISNLCSQTVRGSGSRWGETGRDPKVTGWVSEDD